MRAKHITINSICHPFWKYISKIIRSSSPITEIGEVKVLIVQVLIPLLLIGSV
jgi:hypothetical protein